MTVHKTNKLRAAFVVLSFLALLWAMGLVSYAQQVPESVINEKKKTDAIVVLTGGSGRIDAGVNLLAKGRAARLFISGVAPSVNIAALIATDEPDRNALLANISTGTEAEDTPGNAVETAKWATNNDVNSIRLVTAAYHMPRALSELQYAMPGVEIIAHPVFPEQVKADWWRYPGTASLLAREYTKYLFSTMRMWLSVGASSEETHRNGAAPR
ncbi:MAG: YdcF family protein [Alphaproteobacteria bacterium]|nr:YdcF family protein [Alphaproteobacteria bacterium]